jgi:hypothetical protein
MKIGTIIWVLAGVIVFSGAARAQSLADVARKEAERRKTIQKPAKVYTDADLRRYPVATPPEVQPADRAAAAGAGNTSAATAENAVAAAGPETAGAPATPVEPSVDLGEQYWRKLISDARATLARSSSYLVALRERSRALATQFYTLEDPVARNAAAAQRKTVLQDIEHLKQDMVTQEEAIAKIEADARKANIPPGWIR